MSLIKELSIKIVFLLVSILIYACCSFAKYKIDEYLVMDEKLKEFKVVTSERNRIQTPLIGHQDLDCYDQKNSAVEGILNSYLEAVNKTIEKLYKLGEYKQVDKAIKKIPVPFGKDCSVYVAKNSKFRFRLGKTVDLSTDSIGEKWEKKFFPAYRQYNKKRGALDPEAKPVNVSSLKSKKKLQKNQYVKNFMDVNVKVFSLPTTYKSFQRYVNKVAVIYDFKRQKYFYHNFATSTIQRQKRANSRKKLKFDSFYFYIFLDALDADNFRLFQEVSLMLTRSNKNKSLSLSLDKSKDLFYVGDNLLFSQHRTQMDGLTWIEPFPTFFDYLLNQFGLNIIYSIVVMVLLLLGEFRYCNKRYEVKILLLASLVLFFVHLILYAFYIQNSFHLESELRSSFVQRHINYLKRLEVKFSDSIVEIEQKISKDFYSEKPLSSNVYEDYIGAAYIHTKNPKSSRKQRNALHIINMKRRTIESDIVRSFMGTLIVLHEELEDFKSIKDIPRRMQRVEDKYIQLKDREKDLLRYNDESLDRLITRYKSLYADNRAGKFFKLGIVKQGYYLMWNKKGKGDTFHFFTSAIPGHRLLNRFLNAYFVQDELTPNSKTSARDHKNRRWGNQIVSDEYYNYLYEKHYNNFNKSFNVEVNDEKYWGVFLQNAAFPQIDFLFLSKVNDENKLLLDFEKTFHPANWAIFSTTLFLVLLLCYALLRPMAELLSGFASIEQENYDYSLTIRGRDEVAVVSKGFNKMIHQMDERQQMIPFISGAVGHLFSKMENNQAIIKGNAVVLFSDIRSFTTISENYTPEQIVTMLNGYFTLYQPLADKYDGIIERFIGDAVSMVFLEDMNENYIENSVAMAKEVMLAIDKFNEDRVNAGEWAIKNGIGMSHGYVHFSLVGNEEKTEFFILGDSPEIAEELEAESKRGKNSLIITDDFIENHCKENTSFVPFESLVYPEKRFFEIVQDGYEVHHHDIIETKEPEST
ncbi:MAG: adenylate/guanylate cyclase domain-containing protein [Candidatus Cloacimonetes bacterium]|nr:adenylate/guanylate cyclase domain-containing protein [Candidatus Cloacimonadota bacterium]